MLRGAHTFPGPFSFKAIGANDAAFSAALAQMALVVVGSQGQPSLATRESKKGRHLAVTLTVRCQNAEQVLAVYDALGTVAGLKMLL